MRIHQKSKNLYYIPYNKTTAIEIGKRKAKEKREVQRKLITEKVNINHVFNIKVIDGLKANIGQEIKFVAISF